MQALPAWRAQAFQRICELLVHSQFRHRSACRAEHFRRELHPAASTQRQHSRSTRLPSTPATDAADVYGCLFATSISISNQYQVALDSASSSFSTERVGLSILSGNRILKAYARCAFRIMRFIKFVL